MIYSYFCFNYRKCHFRTMSEVSTDRVLNGMPDTKHQTVVKHGNLNQNEDVSKFPSCPPNGDSCAPESDIALRNAYSVLRDRYNKLKLEHQKLQKQFQKITETFSNRNLQKPNAKAELKEQPGPLDSKTIVLPDIQISDDGPLSAGTLISELEQLRERLDKMSREAQSYVDTDLKDMMENVIPKLKELERQCSSMSEEGPRSLILLLSKETRVKSVSDEKFVSQKTDEEIPGIQESIFLTPNQSLSEDLRPSEDISNASSYQGKKLQSKIILLYCITLFCTQVCKVHYWYIK